MTCPICKRPSAAAYRPFCSRRCADVDLGRWLVGGYAIPADVAEDLGSSDGSPQAEETSESGGDFPLDTPKGRV